MFQNTYRDVLFGIDASLQIGKKLKEMNVKKILCFCDPAIKESADKIITCIEKEEISVSVITDIIPDPSIEHVDDLAKTGREMKVDATVAIGGGSCLDLAKVVNLLMTNEGSIRDYLEHAEVKPANPLILVPTTAGTGSECTGAAMLLDTERKCKVAVVSPQCGAKLSVVDPMLTVGMPKSVTAATGMDALSHAIEGYTSRLSNPMIGVLNRESIRLIANNLETAIRNPDDIEARSNMCIASNFGGQSLLNCLVHFGHAAGHILGANYRIPHGTACALMLPATIKLLVKADDEVLTKKVQDIGECLGVDTKELKGEELADTVAGAIRDLSRRVGLPLLSSFVDSAEDLSKLVSPICSSGDLFFAPFTVDEESVRALLLEEYNVQG